MPRLPGTGRTRPTHTPLSHPYRPCPRRAHAALVEPTPPYGCTCTSAPTLLPNIPTPTLRNVATSVPALPLQLPPAPHHPTLVPPPSPYPIAPTCTIIAPPPSPHTFHSYSMRATSIAPTDPYVQPYSSYLTLSAMRPPTLRSLAPPRPHTLSPLSPVPHTLF